MTIKANLRGRFWTITRPLMQLEAVRALCHSGELCGLSRVCILLVVMTAGCQQRSEVHNDVPQSGRAVESTTADLSRHTADSKSESTGDPIVEDNMPSPSAVQDSTETPLSANEILRERQRRDQTLWAPEVEAQRHEDFFIRLWDRLRADQNYAEVARQFEFQRLELKTPGSAEPIGLSITRKSLDGEMPAIGFADWLNLLGQFQSQGYQLAQSEWHHSQFTPADQDAGRPASSVVSFVVDVTRDDPRERLSVRGKLDVTWRMPQAAGTSPQPERIVLSDATLGIRPGRPLFEPLLTAETDTDFRRVMPLLLYDLDGNGLSEIIVGGLNAIYWNEGGGKFRKSPISALEFDIFDSAVLADFTGDGRVDLVAIDRDRYPVLYTGVEGGGFSEFAQRCADVQFELPKSLTAGDMDGDGDIDLWIAQYKFPYVQGAMPTPFYDANDGYPASLLRNDGQGAFTDVTREAGLEPKRHRRTFSSSFVDLDGDRDLDLIVVNDFCGLDAYENDGAGKFVDVTDKWFDQKHLFGMGHTFGDYDLDGTWDMYLIGMSSTTARRLESLQLGRDDKPLINQMRMAMGYGNRMMLSRSDAGPRYEQAPFNDDVARTGWSWGTSSFDLENDGDPDIYVANGHNSGKSAKDYCTRYWCHDVYEGTSAASQELFKAFGQSLQDLHQGNISWNGFEHNVLWLNDQGRSFANVAFLAGVGFEFDARGVATDDLDGDGRVDLLVVEYESAQLGDAEYRVHALQNKVEDAGHWIGVRLDEAVTGRSPIGAVATLTVGGRDRTAQIVNGDSFSSQHAPVVHWGLGDIERVERLRVVWQDGSEWSIDTPAVDQYLHPIMNR
ncbi:MAG: CRTAC1 family protein [Planctomycetales bacterium]|nr:CRTAC1 family protein [Planctomycetales bacterium]